MIKCCVTNVSTSPDLLWHGTSLPASLLFKIQILESAHVPLCFQIHLRIEKSKEDALAEQKRKDLLKFLNESYE